MKIRFKWDKFKAEYNIYSISQLSLELQPIFKKLYNREYSESWIKQLSSYGHISIKLKKALEIWTGEKLNDYIEVKK